MRNLILATTLTVCFIPCSTPANASCSGANCSSGANTITYGSGSYSALSKPVSHSVASTSAHASSSARASASASASANASASAYARTISHTSARANARASSHASSRARASSRSHAIGHVSQGINTRFGTSHQAACPSGSTRSHNGFCMSNTTKHSPRTANSFASTSSSSYGSINTQTGQIVPFTTSVRNISNHRVSGMASNEFLSPTTCPTNVYNPGGNKVLGCYSVVKPVQMTRPKPIPRYNYVRVVRPIIYVRYPVPMPLPMPMPVCRTQTICGSGW